MHPLSALVLIVEDEFLIRLDAMNALKDQGFQVLEAANAAEAIMILEARSDISVLFTDIQMPGSTDGLKLAAAVRGRWPPIKIIATSGRARIAKGDLPEGAIFIPKPYAAWQIASAVSEILGI